MAARPDWQDDLSGREWSRALWGSRGGRIALSLAFLAGSAWILASGISDPDGFFDRPRATAAFVAAPLLVAVFGVTLFESARDLARGVNRRPLLTERRMQRRMAIVFAIYLALALVAFVLWH